MKALLQLRRRSSDAAFGLAIDDVALRLADDGDAGTGSLRMEN